MDERNPHDTLAQQISNGQEPSQEHSDDFIAGFNAGFEEGHFQGYDEAMHEAAAILRLADKPKRPSAWRLLPTGPTAIKSRWHRFWLGSPSRTAISTASDCYEHGISIRTMLKDQGAQQPIKVEVRDELVEGTLELTHAFSDGWYTRLTGRPKFKTLGMDMADFNDPEDAGTGTEECL